MIQKYFKIDTKVGTKESIKKMLHGKRKELVTIQELR